MSHSPSPSTHGDSVRPPSQSPFFIADERRADPPSPLRQWQTLSSPTASRPSTSGTSNPFSPPASVSNYDPSSRGSPLPSPALAGEFEPEAPSRPHAAQLIGIRLRETFAAPPPRPVTAHSTTASLAPKKPKRMRSTFLEDPSTLEKPWVTKKDPYARIAYFLTYGVAFLGIAASAIRCYFGYKSVPMIKGNLCMVLDEEFDTDTGTVFGTGSKWFHEVSLGGFGNGEFEMTTSSTNNSYVQDGYLYITPTLTSDIIGSENMFNGYSYNLTDCTYNITNPSNATSFDATAYYQSCGAVSNTTTGAIINPVQSARISTRNSASIKYGRVELWPAIWMLPVNDTYGPWPLSGEIDLMESRGNGRSYPDQGIDYVRGSLNWGPLTFLNAVYKTFGWWTQRRTDYGEGFHTYALEWTSDFYQLFTDRRIYVDTRLHYMLELTFNEPFFTRGNFPPVVQNGTTPIVLENPWINGTNASPFDQPFYLILNLAVGGTNGWFPDNAGGKPWLDGSNIAMRNFAESQDTWYPTWGSDGESESFIIDYVKMWQLC
ncbi:glycoside hydrolase family 16 protein [Melanogaster broomeanus]|nr:glycoside hydrolase family 16 protein [Melanogaster broomeanus]